MLNNSTSTIVIETTVLKQSQINGLQRIKLTDYLKPNEKNFLRKIDAIEKVKISNAFYQIKISKNGKESLKNYLEDSIWTKSNSTEILLEVEDSFF